AQTEPGGRRAAHRYRQTATRTRCARSSRARRNGDAARLRLSRRPMLRATACDQLDCVPQGGLDQGEAVPAAARRSGKILDQGLTTDAGKAAAEQPVRRL